MQLKNKLAKLKKIIAGMDSALIAFSGGVDSTFLLKIAAEVLSKDKILAVTADSATYPKEERLFSEKITGDFGVRHKIIKTQELRDKRFVANPTNRCYFCKRELFSRLKEMALKNKFKFILDATNFSDKKDFRPGNKAKRELGVRSPLQEAGLTKDDIRRLSKDLGLVTWDKPSLACLASRIPYGTEISFCLLRRINRAEIFLREVGFKEVRLRHYNGLCRIEVAGEDIPKLIQRRKYVLEKLKKLGYNYITLDLAGYRSGSMNEAIKRG